MEKFIDFITGIDRAVLYFFNNSLSNPVLDFIMVVLTNQWIWLPPLVILAVYLLIKGTRETRIIVTLCIIAVVFTDAFCYRLVKPFVGRIRPFMALPHVLQPHLFQANVFLSKVFQASAAGPSFPSNHAANTFACATTVMMFSRKYGWYFLILALLISVSRVYCGVHYPLDVMAGACIGAGFGILTVFFYRNFEWTRKSKKQR